MTSTDLINHTNEEGDTGLNNNDTRTKRMMQMLNETLHAHKEDDKE